VGRTKLSDLELPDDVKPANSHLALNVVTGPDGAQRQIMRFNMPFGRVGAAEFGTFSIAYARTSELIERMLTNMFIGDPPGNTDRILDFSTAVSGGLSFVPPAALLEALASVAEREADAAPPSAPTAPGDGSLRIGGLRERTAAPRLTALAGPVRRARAAASAGRGMNLPGEDAQPDRALVDLPLRRLSRRRRRARRSWPERCRTIGIEHERPSYRARISARRPQAADGIAGDAHAAPGGARRRAA